MQDEDFCGNACRAPNVHVHVQVANAHSSPKYWYAQTSGVFMGFPVV